MGAMRSFFVEWVRSAPIFYLEDAMNPKIRNMTHGAMIAALYVVLTYLQNMIFPDSASFAIQFRASEALCVLAFFTPAAISGLAVGCLVFNLTYAGALPLDPLVGTLATLAATWGMWRLRRVCWKGIPLAGLLMPALANGILVGWELAVYIGGGFWFNAICVAIGEAAVLLTLGVLLYKTLRHNRLHSKMFG